MQEGRKRRDIKKQLLLFVRRSGSLGLRNSSQITTSGGCGKHSLVHCKCLIIYFLKSNAVFTKVTFFSLSLRIFSNNFLNIGDWGRLSYWKNYFFHIWTIFSQQIHIYTKGENYLRLALSPLFWFLILFVLMQDLAYSLTHSVVQTGLEFVATIVSRSLTCWDYRMSHHAQLFGTIQLYFTVRINRNSFPNFDPELKIYLINC